MLGRYTNWICYFRLGTTAGVLQWSQQMSGCYSGCVTMVPADVWLLQRVCFNGPSRCLGATADMFQWSQQMSGCDSGYVTIVPADVWVRQRVCYNGPSRCRGATADVLQWSQQMSGCDSGCVTMVPADLSVGHTMHVARTFRNLKTAAPCAAGLFGGCGGLRELVSY